MFRVEETIPSNPRWSGKTRDIPVSYGVEILIDDYFILSQHMHLTDGRTDWQTELRQQYRALHYMQSHGKMSQRLWQVIQWYSLESCCPWGHAMASRILDDNSIGGYKAPISVKHWGDQLALDVNSSRHGQCPCMLCMVQVGPLFPLRRSGSIPLSILDHHGLPRKIHRSLYAKSFILLHFGFTKCIKGMISRRMLIHFSLYSPEKCSVSIQAYWPKT